jgi:hypothetical protein
LLSACSAASPWRATHRRSFGSFLGSLWTPALHGPRLRVISTPAGSSLPCSRRRSWGHLATYRRTTGNARGTRAASTCQRYVTTLPPEWPAQARQHCLSSRSSLRSFSSPHIPSHIIGRMQADAKRQRQTVDTQEPRKSAAFPDGGRCWRTCVRRTVPPPIYPPKMLKPLDIPERRISSPHISPHNRPAVPPMP